MHTKNKDNEGKEVSKAATILFPWNFGDLTFANATDDSPFIDIWYNWWYDAPLDDIDAMSNIRKAINRLNIYGNVTTMYSLDTENNKIGVHSKKHMLFIRQIPDLPSYLSANLGDIFSDCRGFMQILQQEEKENVTSE